MPKQSNGTKQGVLMRFTPNRENLADDRAWEDEQRKKRAKKPRPTPAPATGPCCLRCAHWDAPDDPQAFGECRALGVTTERRLPFVDRGTVMDRREAWERYRIATEPLRTHGGFACRAFAAQKEHAA